MAMRQAGLNCDRLLSMHRLTFSASGMNSEQIRIASGVQTSRASCAPASSRLYRNAPTEKAKQQTTLIFRIVLSSLTRVRAKSRNNTP